MAEYYIVITLFWFCIIAGCVAMLAAWERPRSFLAASLCLIVITGALVLIWLVRSKIILNPQYIGWRDMVVLVPLGLGLAASALEARQTCHFKSDAGHCTKCAFDLQGTLTDAPQCPECGNDIRDRWR